MTTYRIKNIIDELRIFIGDIIIFLDGDYSIIIFFFTSGSKLVPIENIHKLVYIINILYIVSKYDHSINKAPPFSIRQPWKLGFDNSIIDILDIVRSPIPNVFETDIFSGLQSPHAFCRFLYQTSFRNSTALGRCLLDESTRNGVSKSTVHFLFIKMKDKRAKDKHTNKGANKESLQLKTDGTEYAQIVKMLGAGRVDAKCFSDGVVRQCTICGRMRKKVWISVGDIVLVSLRDFQDHKGDIVHKYAPDESRQLKAMGEIPNTIRVNEVADMGGEEADNEEDTDDFDFDAI